jgi:hypothetical protein
MQDFHNLEVWKKAHRLTLNKKAASIRGGFSINKT